MSPSERHAFAHFYKLAEKGNGIVSGESAVAFFSYSGLTPLQLGQIWQISDTNNNGFLDQQGFSVALRLIAHLQANETLTEDLINKRELSPLLSLLTNSYQLVPFHSSTVYHHQLHHKYHPLLINPLLHRSKLNKSHLFKSMKGRGSPGSTLDAALVTAYSPAIKLETYSSKASSLLMSLVRFGPSSSLFFNIQLTPSQEPCRHSE